MYSRKRRLMYSTTVLHSLVLNASSSVSMPHEIGEIVEIYDPSLDNEYSSFVFPAQIKSVQYRDDGETIASYDVLPGFGLQTLSFISPSAVRPLTHFEYETRSMCDFGVLKSTHDGSGGMEYEDRLIPCTVLAHATENVGNGGWYSVSYADDLTNEITFSMRARSKILRYVHSDDKATASEELPSNASDVSSRETAINADESMPAFQAGDLVEIYDPSHRSPFAFPAIVTAATYHPDDASYKYNLVHGISKTDMQHLDERMIHTYEAQREGSICSCNVASVASSQTTKDIFMVPCTIVSFSDEKQNYEVILKPNARKSSLRNERRVEENIVSIPYLSVQRVIVAEEL